MYLYTVKFSKNLEIRYKDLNEAFSQAIAFFNDVKAPCDVISDVSGEILLSLKKNEMPYISSAIKYCI